MKRFHSILIQDFVLSPHRLVFLDENPKSKEMKAEISSASMQGVEGPKAEGDAMVLRAREVIEMPAIEIKGKIKGNKNQEGQREFLEDANREGMEDLTAAIDRLPKALQERVAWTLKRVDALHLPTEQFKSLEKDLKSIIDEYQGLEDQGAMLVALRHFETDRGIPFSPTPRAIAATLIEKAGVAQAVATMSQQALPGNNTPDKELAQASVEEPPADKAGRVASRLGETDDK